MIRAAIIGCGPGTPGKGGAHSIAYAHAHAYGDCEGVELVAAATRTPANMTDFQAEFPGTAGYGDYAEMLETERPDLVSVCAYPPTRREMVMKALACGARGVWIEKPMATTLEDARALLEEAERRGARLFVNHQRRYGLPFEWFRDAVREKKIGALLGIDIVFSGTCLLNMGTHFMDAALYCMGERKPTGVLAAVDETETGEFQGTPVETAVLAAVRFDDGSRVTLEFGAPARQDSPAMRAHGTDGFAEIFLDESPDRKSVFRLSTPETQGVENPATSEHFHHSEDPYLYLRRACEDIVRALTDGTPTRIDGEEGYRSLALLLAIYESKRLGRIVPVETR